MTTHARALYADPIPLWPGAPPGSEDWSYEETSSTDPATGIYLINNVSVPSITPVLPEAGTHNRSAVVVAPGGGFAALAWHHEGTSVAEWFAAQGVAAFVLRYRLLRQPLDPAIVSELGPMPDLSDGEAARAWLRTVIGDVPSLATADAEQAIRTIRAEAETWSVDPGRVGIIGFSAGGTVAVQAATTRDPTARPAFVGDIYGAFLEREVPADAPPFFGVVAADDDLCRQSVLDATQKWVAAGASAELHLYEAGGHGFGLVPQGKPVDSWQYRLADWLSARGFLAS